MSKNKRVELTKKAVEFMMLRMELFKGRPAAAEFLGVTEDGLSKWERAERTIPKHAWQQLHRLKETRSKHFCKAPAPRARPSKVS